MASKAPSSQIPRFTIILPRRQRPGECTRSALYAQDAKVASEKIFLGGGYQQLQQELWLARDAGRCGLAASGGLQVMCFSP